MLGIRETHCPYGHGQLQSHTGPGILSLDTSSLPPGILGKMLPQSLMTLDNSVALDPVNKLTNLLVPSGIQGSQNCHWQGCQDLWQSGIPESFIVFTTPGPQWVEQGRQGGRLLCAPHLSVFLLHPTRHLQSSVVV